MEVSILNNSVIYQQNQNQSFFPFDNPCAFTCWVNGALLTANIFAHEVLFLRFGLWVSFSDGNTFLMYTDQSDSGWAAASQKGCDYAIAAQTELNKFLNSNYDKLSIYSW